MKKLLLTLLLLSVIATLYSQNVPFPIIPDWESTPNGHIATGLGLADINGDGWKDLVVANGNDINRQHLVVYYNQGDGTFPLNPDWQSEDIDYHGHLACGDIDQDGDIDVAVSVYIGPAGFGSPGKVKVYYNEGTQLEANPSFVSASFYTFSCTLGDADGDGDLDLATTAGEPYNDILDRGKIFINHEGSFQPEADWESDIEMGSLDVEFGDINRDGFMDIIFVCENTDSYMYLGGESGISTSPAWHSAESQSFINSVDIGYRDGDESIVVMTENSQLGGQGRVRSYIFNNIIPPSSPAIWYSFPFGYGSGIILADLDLDTSLDLTYGGWWLPVKIALGEDTAFQMTPEYTSSTASVVEAIQMADLGRESLTVKEYTLTVDNSMDGKHILILPDQLIEEVDSIEINGTPLATNQYCTVANKSWISFGQALNSGDVVLVNYSYSPHPDMVISNWDSSKGNYIFYNTNPPVSLPEPGTYHPKFTLYPNPTCGRARMRSNSMSNGTSEVRISDLAGRTILIRKVSWNNGEAQIDLSGLSDGTYIIFFDGGSSLIVKKDVY